MAITYNGTELDSLSYNTTEIDICNYNSEEVFTRNKSVVILESVTIKTDMSQVPPPYDSGGYNFNDNAPEKTRTYNIDLGDVTEYTRVEFKWDSSDSINAYGDISGKVRLSTESDYAVLYSEDDRSGNYSIDLTEITGEVVLQFLLSAKSRSNYRGYTSLSAVLIQNVTIYKGSRKPSPEKEEVLILSSATIDSGNSVSDGEHDAPAKWGRYQIRLGNVTPYTNLIFDWDNKGTNAPFGIVQGQWYFKIDNIEQSRHNLFDTLNEVSKRETIKVGTISGDVYLIFETYAKSESSNTSWPARSVLNVKNVKLQK